jgi:hypothetical protein
MYKGRGRRDRETWNYTGIVIECCGNVIVKYRSPGLSCVTHDQKNIIVRHIVL